jgi:hypothetical protein
MRSPSTVEDEPLCKEFEGKMFNILIHAGETAWETDQLMRMDVGRFKDYGGYSGSDADDISSDKLATLKSLEGIDTLLMYETGSKVDLVRYGCLRSIKVVGKQLVFKFEEKGTFLRTVVEEFAGRLGIRSSWELGTTHWAVKDGGIPKAMRAKLKPSYDVVFSFAGEDRKYVKRVAAYLRAKDVRIFYDEYEEVDLWGKDLAEHFELVYSRSGQYCVMFISKDYVNKMWIRHERRVALSRALKEQGEYILPARFDDAEVPGISPTVKYIPLAAMSPAKFGKVILEKLRLQ